MFKEDFQWNIPIYSGLIGRIDFLPKFLLLERLTWKELWWGLKTASLKTASPKTASLKTGV